MANEVRTVTLQTDSAQQMENVLQAAFESDSGDDVAYHLARTHLNRAELNLAFYGTARGALDDEVLTGWEERLARAVAVKIWETDQPWDVIQLWFSAHGYFRTVVHQEIIWKPDLPYTGGDGQQQKYP